MPEMATAVLIFDESREVEYANASAETLFRPVDPIGCTLPALLTSCAAEGGDNIFAPIDTGQDSTEVRIRLADGRLLDSTVRPLSGGGFVLTLDDVTAYVRRAELARRDALTGLPNRTTLRDRLVERLGQAKRAGQAVAVLYVDLDRFKAVNDTLGHPVGDALLCKVAERFKSALREGDIVARLGGDEFAIIQSDAPQPAAAKALAERLVDLISRAYVLEGHMIHIGASVGIAISPDHGLEPDLLFKNADLALYKAKADGRGVYRLFQTTMDERIQARRLLEIDLRRALAMKQFELAYQPQIRLDTNAVAGFEALLRWRHGQKGLVSPADFIPLAEEIGVIVPIGDWVLKTACKEAAAWPTPASVAVNISPVQFRSGKVAETVLSALAHSGLEPSRLELEITESALLENSEQVSQVLERLRSIGVRIALDDFGTGYSSLSYLQKFPLDKIKIDQAFVRGIDESDGRRAIVRAITTLAASLNMTTTAEGVETPAELACIRAQGCDQVQGFLTGRPAPAATAISLLAGSIAI